MTVSKRRAGGLRRRTPLVLVLGLCGAGCMVVPRTTSTYNAECRVVEKRITLEAQQAGPIGACRSNAECAGLLAFYGIVAATSAVVSGSIAVVGNVAYWLERQGQCHREEPPPPAPRAAPAS